MPKPARKTLSLRNADVPALENLTKAPEETFENDVLAGTTTYGHAGTEVIFSDKAGLITHVGPVEEATVAANIDELFGDGAFVNLRMTGVLMKDGDTILDGSIDMYSLSVDASILAQYTGDRPAEDPVTAVDDGFVEDTVFSAGADEQAVSDALEDEQQLDLSGSKITFATTKAGAPYAAIRTPGARTVMAFGPVAEAIEGRNVVSVVIAKGRSTDKIIAIRTAANEMIQEEARAA